MSRADTMQGNKHPVIALDGAIFTTVIERPDRAFCAEIVFYLQHPQLLKLGSRKPPSHFHPYQDEYFTVIEGYLAVEIDGIERIIGPEDGEICIKAWTHHRLYPPPNDGSLITKFVASATDTLENYKLDNLFFSNWYAYQDEILLRGKKPEAIQILSMFDAGGSYIPLPWWVPFRYTVSRMVGIVVGRWLGGLLGYQPYYAHWTLDWDIACHRMRKSYFHNHLVTKLV